MSAVEPNFESRYGTVVLRSALLVGFVLRAAAAWNNGIYWPDEIYQSFEVAHHLVFGYGILPWEYIEGARTWALPLVVAGLMKVALLLGIDAPRGYILVVKLAFAALSALTGLGVFRLSRALRASYWPALAAACVWWMSPVAIYFAPRAMGENVAAAAVTFGSWLLIRELDVASPSRLRIALGASLLGLAVWFRIQVALFPLAFIAAFIPQRRRVLLPVFLATMCAWAVGMGLFDAAAWHGLANAKAYGLFHSVAVYLRFSLIEGRPDDWGTAPWWYYGRYLMKSSPLMVVVAIVGAAAALRRGHFLLVTLVAVFGVAHMAVPHKELRFILPVLPLAPALASEFFEAGRKRTLISGVAIAVALVSAAATPRLTTWDLGAYLDTIDSKSAWQVASDVNELLLEASTRSDLCGLRVSDTPWSWTGGMTYLHRRVPLYRSSHPADSGNFNYLIARSYRAEGKPIVARSGDYALIALGITSCVPDENFRWELEAHN